MFVLMYCIVGTYFRWLSIDLVNCWASGCSPSGWAISEDGPIWGGPICVCAATIPFWVTVVQKHAGTVLDMLYMHIGLVMRSIGCVGIMQAILWPTPGVGHPTEWANRAWASVVVTLKQVSVVDDWTGGCCHIGCRQFSCYMVENNRLLLQVVDGPSLNGPSCGWATSKGEPSLGEPYRLSYLASTMSIHYHAAGMVSHPYVILLYSTVRYWTCRL